MGEEPGSASIASIEEVDGLHHLRHGVLDGIGIPVAYPGNELPLGYLAVLVGIGAVVVILAIDGLNL